jgi:hypothetical protein
VPAVIQLGIMGKISYNTGDKCFGWGVDAALGVFFGVKIGGYSIGISINLIGSLSLDEIAFDGIDATSDLAKMEAFDAEGNGDVLGKLFFSLLFIAKDIRIFHLHDFFFFFFLFFHNHE